MFLWTAGPEAGHSLPRRNNRRPIYLAFTSTASGFVAVQLWDPGLDKHALTVKRPRRVPVASEQPGNEETLKRGQERKRSIPMLTMRPWQTIFPVCRWWTGGDTC
ncbi:hypothetical protein CC78DRAFT_275651 [Lojkania enalia]|uniref:Uncharacterized protein n=1 Tax=Lojkania enalia TaxID=147567 RepID=A0A9P4MZ94_9PLEO|nr:hypothetical protein CC78DRAFT_275651 [Didymosphaeria enalia]